MTESSDAFPKVEMNKSDRSKNIVLGLGSLTVQNLATSGLGFLFLAILLRLLPPVQYGVYSGVILAIGLASSISGFGLNQTVARFVASLKETEESSSWLAARKILYISLLLSGVCTAVYSILSPYLSLYFTRTTHWTGIFLLGGVYLFLLPLSYVCQGIIQGFKRYVLLAKMNFVARLGTVIFSIAVLLMYRNVSIAITSWILYSAVLVAWVLALTFRNLTRASGKFNYGEILRYTYPLGAAGIIAVVASTSDQVVVGGYLSAVSLGIYSAAVTLSGVLTQVLAVPLTTALLPEFSSSKGVAEISNGLRLALRFIALIVLPISLFVATISGQLISLFSGGGGYLGGTSSLELIAIFYVFTAIQLTFLALFQAIGKTGLVLLVGVLTAVTDIGAAVVLVPSFGLVGAAVTKTLVGLVGAAAVLHFSREYLHKLDGMKFYSKCAAASLVPFFATITFSHFYSHGLLTLLPCVVIYSAVFLACMKFFKLLNAEDRSLLMHVIPSYMRRIVSYL